MNKWILIDVKKSEPEKNCMSLNAFKSIANGSQIVWKKDRQNELQSIQWAI